MADQTVKVKGDSGSHENVALELMKYIIERGGDASELSNADELLTLYRRCLGATLQAITVR